MKTDTVRAAAFSDGVFAIVITLLVLDLKAPPAEPGRLHDALLARWPTYAAYVTSYLYVAVVRLNHKAAWVRIRAMDRGLHWANFGVLFTVALLPFPTAVVADAVRKGDPADARTAVALYALVGVLLCASWVAFFLYLGRHPELLKDDVGERFFVRESGRAWARVVLYAAGALGYLVGPPVAMVIFFVLPVFYGVTSHGLDAGGKT
ncbi:MAG: hypothetical protein JWO38_6590 [Gemmataceae bacterium]|nr:hypothetical protein [Gemmataceae bacterium]